MAEGVGDRFQRETKYHPDRMAGGGLDWASQPSAYKEYPQSKLVELPRPRPPSSMALHDALVKRRSVRDFSDDPLSLDQLSYLLWAAGGLQPRRGGDEFRTAPSAGALYPIETYVAVNRVAGVVSGIYHYSVKSHLLEELKSGDFGRQVATAALGQEMCADAAAVFIWTAIFQRAKWKYKQRAYRYVYLDAGHIAENFALAAVALGLGTCQIGALFDDECNRIIGVDGLEESVIYMSALGAPAGPK